MKADYPIVMFDDDYDDIDLFQEALREVAPSTQFKPFVDFVSTYQFLMDEKNPVPDLLFLDVHLGIATGLFYLRLIKKISRIANTKIIIYTTTLNPPVEKEAMELRAYGCFQKPNTYPELCNLLREILDEVSVEHSTQRIG